MKKTDTQQNERQTIAKRITALVALGERQGYVETQARRLIELWLTQSCGGFSVQTFVTRLPKTIRAELRADGVRIPAKSTSFVSGTIEGAEHLTSSLISSQRLLYDANINFNPSCKTISRSNHYFAPSVAINRDDVERVMQAKKVQGRVIVKPYQHTSANILVGNTKNPKTILFCHYDSIHSGAVDNASGVVLSLYLIESYPQLLETCLFVIAGNEELSYDEPIYWGHGYRAFEQRYSKLLERARNIFVLDCVGQTKTVLTTDPRLLMLGFPISAIKKLAKKITMVCGDLGKLMKIYHSNLDTPDVVNSDEIVRAGERIRRRLKCS